MRQWSDGVRRQADAAFGAIEQALADLGEADRVLAETLLEERGTCYGRIEELGRSRVHAAKTRLHGDYHLGQVLVAQNDFYILDFEGEPARPLEERRAKLSPLKDVAGMLRSFDYAAWSAAFHFGEMHPSSQSSVLALALWWRDAVQAAFLEAYRETIAGCPSHPDAAGKAQVLLDLFLLEKALYEVCYEAANRPGWLRIPLKGVAGLLHLEREETDQDHGPD
jgi:maltose alpha-D-glucosyltransferase/alpha-amylase